MKYTIQCIYLHSSGTFGLNLSSKGVLKGRNMSATNFPFLGQCSQRGGGSIFYYKSKLYFSRVFFSLNRKIE